MEGEVPAAAPWEMRVGEAAWYGRFVLYRDLGPGRTVRAAYALEAAQAEGLAGVRRRLPKAWRQAAERFEWEARARAWDAWRASAPQDAPQDAAVPALAVPAAAGAAEQSALDALQIIRQAAARAARTLVETLEEGDPGKRRLAALSVLTWSGLTPARGDEEEVVPLRVIDFTGGSGPASAGGQE